METILITGGTGLIGKAISKKLISEGYKVIILTRKLPIQQEDGQIAYAHWDVNNGKINQGAIQEADHIIHLAGANVAGGRWTTSRKKEIIESRVLSGKLIVKALHEFPNKVKTVISASAIGWYGPDPVIPNLNPFVETDPADHSFLGATCKQWEEAIAPVIQQGKRLVTFRIGIVLSKEGGAYVEFKKPLQFGVASILGSGKQVVSWIHIDDLVNLLLYALRNEKIAGVYNAVSPKPSSNAELIKAIAKAKGGFSITAKVPSIVLKLMLGEMSVEVLKSATVSSEKLQQEGFAFQYPDIQTAADHLQRHA